MLPPLYARWVDELLGDQPPDEMLATCSSCAMCASTCASIGESRAEWRYFEPNVKCCTYTPDLPNYLAGAILMDDDPSMARGRAGLMARIVQQSGVTPLAVSVAQPARLHYQETAETGFGRDAALLCPHYIDEDGGICGIWRYRNSVCATYFCKYNRGGVGKSFWHALRDLLLKVEHDLGMWCLTELGGGPAWAGKEVELYVACARLVAPLSWADVIAACDPSVRVLARSLQDWHARLLSTEIPEALRAEPYHVLGSDAGKVQLRGYSSLDTVEIPAKLLEVLPYFDGRPTREALAVIQTERKLRIHDGLLRRLVDYGFLSAA
jgi:hypothetical protein